MARSTLSARNRTTTAKEGRPVSGCRLGKIPQSHLVEGELRVNNAPAPAFLGLRGAFKVGPGDLVADVREMREQMGREDRDVEI